MTPTRLPVRLLLAALATACALPAAAQNLVTLYESARAYDATYLSAKAQYDANLFRAAQAKANVLPSANLTAGVNRVDQEVRLANGQGGTGQYTARSASVGVSQPLYRPANVALYRQGLKGVDAAQAQLQVAEQDLLVRVTQAYFDVLAAQDSLLFVQAQKTATNEQLAFAKRNFEVGTSTITDSREAQARFDLVIAQEIAAENDLRVRKIALDTLTGTPNAIPKPLALPATLPALLPDSPDTWVQQAEAAHPNIRLAQTALDVAQLETQRAEAGHKPTLDLVANYNQSNNPNSSSGTSALGTRVNTGTLGVNFNLPLFAGFATQNRIRETLSLEEKAQSDLQAARRSVELATRTAFFGVQSGTGQVKALEAAEVSTQSALDANKLGYQVGVRINIDVLNSQSQLFQTKRDLARARYDVLVNGLRLRQASGTLQPSDLQSVNGLLAN
ncbi:MAG: TolC family outer membrane protein [Pseudomonadota bacterium]